jgi:CHAT domain-containing protein
MPGPENQRLKSLVFALPLLLLWTFGCSRLPDPQKTFDHAQQTFARGDLGTAKREADFGFRRFSGRDEEWAWKFRVLEADILWNQGLGRDASSLLNSTLPPQLASSDLAIKQKIIQGGANVLLTRFPEADQRLAEAEALSKTSHSSLTGEIARCRGLLERAQNDLDGANRFFRQSLQLAKQQQDGRLEASDLANLGQVALGKEHYDESIDWSNAANKKAQILGDRRLAELAQGNLAWAFYKMGDFDKALSMYQDAETTATQLGANYHQILWLNNIGLVYYEWNQLALAEDYYRQSLALAQNNQNPGLVIDALTELAFVAVQKGQLEQAQRYAEQAFQLAHGKNDRLSELYPTLVEGQISAGRGDYKQAEETYRRVASDSQSDLALRWEAQNDLARLYERQHKLGDADQQYREALATIERARSSLQREDFRLPFLANAAHLYDDYIRFLVDQGKNNQALQLADYSRARTLAEGLGVLPGNSAAVPAELDAQQIARNANATILFYWLGREQSYLWAITAHGITLYPLPPGAEIDAAVQHYRQALLGWQEVLDTTNQAGSHLYDIVLRPARKRIAPDSRVIVISDGALDNLNFETLPVPEPKLHYWIEEATVLSASSLRVLAASQTRRQKAGGGLLLIGDAAVSTPDYARLPNAALEIESVQKHFASKTQQVFTGDRATPAAYLKNNPGQFSFIHFVAHATASKLSPLDSAIVLSPISGEQDSFKLYARDITQLPLFADLVTISSCYGAGSRAYSGEGLVGLSWAFLRAGAHNVIGALWEVSDASTARLMDNLYGELKRGRPPEAALRSAKLSLLHSDDVFRKPFYWAPFQLYTGR